jgi:hypothetical protein
MKTTSRAMSARIEGALRKVREPIHADWIAKIDRFRKRVGADRLVKWQACGELRRPQAHLVAARILGGDVDDGATMPHVMAEPGAPSRQ